MKCAGWHWIIVFLLIFVVFVECRLIRPSNELFHWKHRWIASDYTISIQISNFVLNCVRDNVTNKTKPTCIWTPAPHTTYLRLGCLQSFAINKIYDMNFCRAIRYSVYIFGCALVIAIWMPTSAPFAVTRAEPTLYKNWMNSDELVVNGTIFNMWFHILCAEHMILDVLITLQIDWQFCWLSVNWRSTAIRCVNLNISINLDPMGLTKLNNTNVYESVSSEIKSFGLHLLLAVLYDIAFFLLFFWFVSCFSTGFKRRREKKSAKKKKKIEWKRRVETLAHHWMQCIGWFGKLHTAYTLVRLCASIELCSEGRTKCFGHASTMSRCKASVLRRQINKLLAYKHRYTLTHTHRHPRHSLGDANLCA